MALHRWSLILTPALVVAISLWVLSMGAPRAPGVIRYANVDGAMP